MSDLGTAPKRQLQSAMATHCGYEPSTARVLLHLCGHRLDGGCFSVCPLDKCPTFHYDTQLCARVEVRRSEVESCPSLTSPASRDR